MVDYCSSDNGRAGGAQAVILGHSCLTRGSEEKIVGRVQQEILHAVGSLHEMNRPDRDSHITVDPTVYRKNKAQRVPTVAKAKRFEKIFWFKEFNLGWF